MTWTPNDGKKPRQTRWKLSPVQKRLKNASKPLNRSAPSQVAYRFFAQMPFTLLLNFLRSQLLPKINRIFVSEN
jgi:hypothetical protein